MVKQPQPDRTWDGVEIARDHPTGGTVCVRRTTPTGVREVLILHRSHHGPAFQGDWAWTSPAGCRQPGEPAYPGVLRELAEEAGIEGHAPWAVDLSGGWALYAVDVPYHLVVDLVDPEHDRFAWVPASEAAARMLPPIVGEQLLKAASVPSLVLTFRRMTPDDLPGLARWQQAPHVREWWGEDGSPDEGSVRERYLPRLAEDSSTRMWVVEADDAPVGFLQDYPVASDPDYAMATGDPGAVGLDYAIGAADLVGRGLGTRMIWEFCRDVLRRDFPEAPRFLASPSHRNERSLRTLEKCGFIRGARIDGPKVEGRADDPEIVCTLDVRHWLG